MLQTDHNDTQHPQTALLIHWWQSINPDIHRFFQASQAFNPDMPSAEFTEILVDLETARVNIQAAAYPIQATEARRYLIEAITSVLRSFSAAVGQNDLRYTYYKQQARKHMQLFQHVMDELGIRA